MEISQNTLQEFPPKYPSVDWAIAERTKKNDKISDMFLQYTI